MKRRYFNFLLFTGLGLALTSCNKFLDQNPDMRTEIDNVQKVSQLVGTAYPSYNYLAMAEHSSDNVRDKGVAVGQNDSPYTEYYYWEESPGTGNNTTTQYWNTCYAAIAAANQALESIETNNLTGRDILPYRGEALVARAYAHFMLALFFAQPYEIGGSNSSPGIPYVDKPETVALAQYGRGTVLETYDKIRKDLEEGLPLLAGGVWQVPKYHFNTSSANAFASRFYLFTGEFQKALNAANNVFENGDYTNKIRPMNSVLRLQTSAEYLQGMTRTDKDFNLLIRETYSVYQRTNNSVFQRFGYGQVKYNEFFASPIFPGTTMYTKGLSYSSGQHYTSYMWNEYFHYTNVQAGIGFPYIMQPILTSDEALFNRAEAYAQLENYPKALEDINHLLSHRVNNYNAASHSLTIDKALSAAETTDVKAAIIHVILKMKQRAFVTEGIRWMDIVRHRLPVVHVVLDENDEPTEMVLAPTDLRRVFQIPSEASLAGVSQNPR